MSTRSFALAPLVLLAGCIDRPLSDLPIHQAGEISKDIPAEADLDILFVIDNSGSTQDKQTVFAANFPRFVAALDAFPVIGRPNLHIGVVSTTVDVGVDGFGNCHPAASEDGRLQNVARVGACSTPRDRYIVDVKAPTGGRQTNYSGTLDQTLSCIAQLGANGCGFEAPLEAMKRALDGSRPENAGFLRPGAFLAVVFLTDEDDASVEDSALFAIQAAMAGPGDFRAQPMSAYTCNQTITAAGPASYTNCRVRTDSYLRDPARYFEFLSSLKRLDRTAIALIGGDPTTDITTGPITMPPHQFTQPLALLPSCSATINGNDAMGRPAIRLTDFTNRFGDNGLFRTVCQPDYSQALADIGERIGGRLSPCLDGEIDTTDWDPNNPGLQLDCTVSDLSNPDSFESVETSIYACAMAAPDSPSPGGTRPCWWVTPNAATCATTATQLELRVERTSPPAPGSSVRVRCATR